MTATARQRSPVGRFAEDDRVLRIGFGHLPIGDFTEALDRVAGSLKATCS